jgi:hypothetical protein
MPPCIVSAPCAGRPRDYRRLLITPVISMCGSTSNMTRQILPGLWLDAATAELWAAGKAFERGQVCMICIWRCARMTITALVDSQKPLLDAFIVHALTSSNNNNRQQQTVGDRVGANEKTKLVAKLQPAVRSMHMHPAAQHLPSRRTISARTCVGITNPPTFNPSPPPQRIHMRGHHQPTESSTPQRPKTTNAPQGQGPPPREPVVSEAERTAMMAYYFKRQEELKVSRKSEQVFWVWVWVWVWVCPLCRGNPSILSIYQHHNHPPTPCPHTPPATPRHSTTAHLSPAARGGRRRRVSRLRVGGWLGTAALASGCHGRARPWCADGRWGAAGLRRRES